MPQKPVVEVMQNYTDWRLKYMAKIVKYFFTDFKIDFITFVFVKNQYKI